MQLYVKQTDQSKPYLSDVSTEDKEGYVLKPALTTNQVVALLNYPDKCFLDDNGAVIVPNQLPLDEQQQEAEKVKASIVDLNNKITELSNDNTTLNNQLANANSDKAALQVQIANIQKQSVAFMQQIAGLNNELAKYKQGGDK